MDILIIMDIYQEHFFSVLLAESKSLGK